MTAKLRPRSAWEAIDLGLVFLQANGKIAYLAMLAASLPFALAAIMVHWYTSSPFLAFLTFWWFKPLYDRVILHHFGRALFDETPSKWEILLTALKLLFKGAGFQSITWQRFDFARSFNLPVWLLEGLRGKQRFKRSKVLQNRGRSNAVWLGTTCIHFVLMLQFSAMALLYAFAPETGDTIIELLVYGSDTTVVNWLTLAVYLVAEFLIEPLFVASGFTLYINRRTELEAWDIELAFRRLVQRRSKANTPGMVKHAATLLLVILVCLVSPTIEPACAQEDAVEEQATEPKVTRARAKEIAEEIAASEEFRNREQRREWVPKNPKESKSSTSNSDFGLFSQIGRLFAGLFEIGLWIGVVILILLIYWKRDFWLRLFRAEEIGPSAVRPPAHDFVQSLKPETLPEDIPEAAQQLWQQGKKLAALSLLYRGTVLTTVNKFHIPVKSCDTEHVFLERLSDLDQARQQYIKGVVRSWQSIAYANRFPEERFVLELIQQWHTQLGSTAS